MEFEELKYWYAFNRTGVVGPVRFNQLLKIFGTAKEAWKADATKFENLGWGEKGLKKLQEVKNTVDLEKELESLLSAGITLLTFIDEEYPKLLREITDKPFLLYLKGKIKKLDEKAVAVVGSRRMTAYGMRVVRNLVADLTLSGLTIVSGLALGIDALAHRVALESNGRTIAVLGSGIDNIYPWSNRLLGERIIKENCGALISEFPPGTKAYPYNFPFRNRLISGLSLGVIVIEAAAKSGTLITAGHALNQGREVFAVPGSILSDLSKGPHSLIKMGAKVVETAQDVLEELDLKEEKQKLSSKEIIPDSKEEELILKSLGEGILHIDELIRRSALETAEVSATLTLMEITGKVKNLGGGRYCKG